jgi:Zn-dependent peptidase ImmA (M78 family)
MIDKNKLSQQALYQATKLRQKLDIDLLTPICIFDIVEKYGVEIFFQEVKSMEGMYIKDPGPYILIGSLRPQGRQVYSCAHEFGHHIFDHGTKVDEIKNGESDQEEEYLANSFAGFLLMPHFALKNILKAEDWDPLNLDAIKIFTLASYFGVGYTTILNHMHYSLKLLPTNSFRKLLSIKRKEIISHLTKSEINDDLVIVDSFWGLRPIDLQVGNFLLISTELENESNNLIIIESNSRYKLYQASKPGIVRLCSYNSNRAIFCRISRKSYIGWNKYKHLEDPDYE